MKTAITNARALAQLKSFTPLLAPVGSDPVMRVVSVGGDYSLFVRQRSAFRSGAGLVGGEGNPILLEASPGVDPAGMAIGFDGNGAAYVALQSEHADLAWPLAEASLSDRERLMLSHVIALIEAKLEVLALAAELARS